MSVFPDWEKHVVPQKRPKTGCIPTGYEMLLRAAHVKNVDFNTFQDEFDLEHQGLEKNNFTNVATAVRKKYPNINFESREFSNGADKLRFIEERLKQKLPTLVSLAIVQNGRLKDWHIMPVVDANNDTLTLLWSVDSAGKTRTLKMAKNKFVLIHDKISGGKDVAYLKTAKSNE